MKEISYYNNESNKSIKLLLDKKRIFIYGKNGSGKTTFSNSADLDPKYVFNESFIRKNVYVIDDEGAKVDANTKSNFSGLLIGEDVVKLRNELDSYNIKKKEIKNKLDVIKNKIIEKLNKVQITSNYSLLKEDTIDSEIAYPEDGNIEKLKDKYICKIFDGNYIKLNEEELKLTLNQIRDNALIKEMVDNINKTNYLKELVFSKEKININQLNAKIRKINENIEILHDIEEILKQKNIKTKDWETIKKCLELQEKSGIDECILCGNTKYKEGFAKWNLLRNNELAKLKEEVISLLKNEIDKINNLIIENKKSYITVEPKLIKNVDKFNKSINDVVTNIIDNKSIKEIGTENFDVCCETIDINSLINNVVYNVSLDYMNDYVFYNSMSLSLTNKIASLKEEIKKVMDANAEEYEGNINRILRCLGVENKNIEIKVEGRGGLEIKYSLNVKENKIAELSDGQKHKLALAVFLNSIRNKDLSESILVFDDPIVSLDELSYHLFKDYLVNTVLKEYKDINKSPTLIVLTHNFSYFTIQISNIINSESLRNDSKILRMDSDDIHIMNPDAFRLDDIALYKKALHSAKCQKEIINIAIISDKIVREMLDIKLRFEGKPINDNPEMEIPLLNLGNNEKTLKDNEHLTVKFRKSKSNNFDEAIACIQATRSVAEILGFHSFISNDEIERIKQIEIEDDRKSDENIIVEEIANLFRSNEEKNSNYIQYLNHPRISFTKNMFSSALDLHE